MDEGELERCREELKRERAFTGRLLESLPTSMVISRPDGKIASANRRCEDLFGRSKEELGEVLIEDLYEERKEIREAFEEAKRRGFARCEATPLGIWEKSDTELCTDERREWRDY